MTSVVLTLMLGASWQQGVTPSQESPAGIRVKLTVGQLFIPHGYRPLDGNIHLVVHLHGTADVAEQNLIRSGSSAVLVTVALKGLSSAYADLFSQPESFRTILAESLAQLKERDIAENPMLGRVTITSFSAGFGGVRELLKSEEFYERIDALVMADSIYAGFEGDPRERRVAPTLMAGFLRFARDAAAGKKAFVISHSALKPDAYASTAETADYLLDQLELPRERIDETWSDGWRCVSQCTRGGFRLYGFAGDTGPDHMRHLHNLWRLMRLAEPAEKAAPQQCRR